MISFSLDPRALPPRQRPQQPGADYPVDDHNLAVSRPPSVELDRRRACGAQGIESAPKRRIGPPAGGKSEPQPIDPRVASFGKPRLTGQEGRDLEAGHPYAPHPLGRPEVAIADIRRPDRSRARAARCSLLRLRARPVAIGRRCRSVGGAARQGEHEEQSAPHAGKSAIGFSTPWRSFFGRSLSAGNSIAGAGSCLSGSRSSRSRSSVSRPSF